MNVFVFDIETIPDATTGRRLLNAPGLNDEQVIAALQSQAKESTGQSFVKPHMQQIVAISAVLRQGNSLKIWSLGEPDSSEAELITRFFAGIEKFTPTMVSWNGGQFDLPVLHYRALYHGIAAPLYWEHGDNQPAFKYNNYLNRYHQRHIDLMDTLAAYSAKSYARLDDIALMLGLPGKMGMAGDKVLAAYQAGKIADIRNYCETDVLNTYLVYLRFQLMRGLLHSDDYDTEIELAKMTLGQAKEAHLLDFLEAWEQNEYGA